MYFQAGFSRDESVSSIIALFLSNGKDRRGPARRRRGGGGKETCTARFLAAMIGSGRQCLLNRWAVSKREHTLRAVRLSDLASPFRVHLPRVARRRKTVTIRLRRSGWRSRPVSWLGFFSRRSGRSLSASVSGQVSHRDELFLRDDATSFTCPLAAGIFPFLFFGVTPVNNAAWPKPSVFQSFNGPGDPLSCFHFFVSFSSLPRLPWIPVGESPKVVATNPLAILSLRPAIYGSKLRWRQVEFNRRDRRSTDSLNWHSPVSQFTE